MDGFFFKQKVEVGKVNLKFVQRKKMDSVDELQKSRIFCGLLTKENSALWMPPKLESNTNVSDSNTALADWHNSNIISNVSREDSEMTVSQSKKPLLLSVAKPKTETIYFFWNIKVEKQIQGVLKNTKMLFEDATFKKCT